jgi:PHD/YefM family antitoxin component YafN of YafNO toxin-antitoxin module
MVSFSRFSHQKYTSKGRNLLHNMVQYGQKERGGQPMLEFISAREMRSKSKELWRKLAENHHIVITNNGKPAALMLDLTDSDLLETLHDLQQAAAMRAVNRLRSAAVEQEKDAMTDQEIQDEINAYRKERSK